MAVKKMSGYNAFIKGQLKVGKTFKQAVAFWKKEKKEAERKKMNKKIAARIAARTRKAKTLKKKTKPKTKIKTKIIRIKSKPKVKTVTRTKIVKVSGEIPEEKIRQIVEETLKTRSISGVPVEQTAIEIVRLYFEEIAKFGLKREMDLEALINAYQYALRKLKGQ